MRSSGPQHYDPRYGNVTDIPITGPGSPNSPEMDHSFTEPERRRALFFAESQFEADVNDGKPLDRESIEHFHTFACDSSASYILVVGPEHPTSIRAGDFADDGSGRSDFADRFLAMYDRAVDSIIEAEGDASEGDGSGVTTHFDGWVETATPGSGDVDRE